MEEREEHFIEIDVNGSAHIVTITYTVEEGKLPLSVIRKITPAINNAKINIESILPALNKSDWSTFAKEAISIEVERLLENEGWNTDLFTVHFVSVVKR